MRIAILVAGACWALVACSADAPLPPSGNASFLIDSPIAGSSVAGTTWFSVQAADPTDITSVEFAAGGRSLGVDSAAGDGFRVFLAARDHAAGALELRATVTTRDGATTIKTITVTNVPAPPATATVGSAGAVLGASESDGAISTITIPPGDAVGAMVTFATRTRDEVRTATGVDYDALGVTFLGAQQITSTRALDGPLAVTSGGFGPRVQPGQAVLQYRIAPDADGDGRGELVVVNVASVAPNGDIISNPVPPATLDGGTTAQARAKPSHGPTGGPPGTVLLLHVRGFNPSSANGNVAEWTCVNGATFSGPGIVFADTTPGAQIFQTVIPGCPPGAASLVLRNLSTGASVGPGTITVTASPAVPSAAAAVGSVLNNLQQLLGGIPASGDAAADQALSDAKQQAEETEGAVPGATQPEGEIAAGSDASDAPPAHTGGPCLTDAERDLLRTQRNLMLTLALASVPIDAGGDFTRSDLFREAAEAITELLEHFPPCTPRPPSCPPVGPVPPGFTGMGSAVPPGGPGCGNVLPPPPSRSSPNRRAGKPATVVVDGLAGRVLVRVTVDGQALPFSGATDGGGYFYVPFIPAGRRFTAQAIDVVTRESRTFDGVGPAAGQAVAIPGRRRARC